MLKSLCIGTAPYHVYITLAGRQWCWYCYGYSVGGGGGCEGSWSSVYGFCRDWMQLSSREELTCTFITWLKETEAEGEDRADDEWAAGLAFPSPFDRAAVICYRATVASINFWHMHTCTLTTTDLPLLRVQSNSFPTPRRSERDGARLNIWICLPWDPLFRAGKSQTWNQIYLFICIFFPSNKIVPLFLSGVLRVHFRCKQWRHHFSLIKPAGLKSWKLRDVCFLQSRLNSTVAYTQGRLPLFFFSPRVFGVWK